MKSARVTRIHKDDNDKISRTATPFQYCFFLINYIKNAPIHVYIGYMT